MMILQEPTVNPVLYGELDLNDVVFNIVKALQNVSKGKYPVLHSTYEGLHYSESITEGKLKKLKKQLEGNKMPFDM